ncbi:MBL fold metallo-hydrolase [Aspergillus fijiensis CBS 313.89]|uniref:Zn-dependent hydrolases of the beta-lactamase protein n=1 Tax=Aspergillus fijiensis CBS 313.89 TaxID=1448319 RepID=A0A8G1RVX0_9EURO|nr:Zn-dependent hydrolases of the beta-lactamase protein [Aspergillus fijiensis CBS 313.89]RAK79948.1 Zn-dependent hydrolases of the beta-lactamase protein [Aspergillus fijiensis CBS 313.89]
MSPIRRLIVASVLAAATHVSGSPLPDGPEQGGNINFNITHIINAASVLEINGVNFLVDPFFSPQNTTFPIAGFTRQLWSILEPALQPEQIPPIDAVLLSHEDHPDNLDPISRMRFLDGRRVLTTPAGTEALKPRPGVQAMKDWETMSLKLNGNDWNFTGTPCEHVPGEDVIGFVIVGPNFGTTDGLPNAIWYSGDTIYLPGLAQIKERFHVKAALINMGAAYVLMDDAMPLRITMNGTEVAQTFQDVGAEVLVPLHYSSFNHFPEAKEGVVHDFELSGISDKVHWVTPGESTKII